MSGHSRWAQIKHKKAATDAKKGKLFSRLSKMLTIAAKERGPDPKTNSRLAAAIDEARKENLPKENIERAIKRASEKEALDLKEVTYEAYGPGGSAIIITAVTDNANRTTNEVKHILSLHEGKLGVGGSAMWAFDHTGEQGYASKFPVKLSPEDSKKFESLLEALSEQDETENVYSNAETSD
ncbi:YebC/PmpR family DNA-binding transcriptional regulator [Candidatus Giovannonibacteria bacterium]|nr:YebC/PmpR family DNA-binding transcriptional regulator [Candidatus Giovannonibacteria bacterium]